MGLTDMGSLLYRSQFGVRNLSSDKQSNIVKKSQTYQKIAKLSPQLPFVDKTSNVLCHIFLFFAKLLNRKLPQQTEYLKSHLNISNIPESENMTLIEI